MQKFFIRHKLKPGDITHLSDQDSEIAITNKAIKEGDLVELETLTHVFRAEVTFIEKASVEVEVLEELREAVSEVMDTKLTLMQSVTSDGKFEFLIEKAVELGVNEIQPIYTKYSLMSWRKAMSRHNRWKAVLTGAIEQSRSKEHPYINKTLKLTSLQFPSLREGELRICLTTEDVKALKLNKVLTAKVKALTIAIGPEKGWHSEDLAFFKVNGFKFVSLGDRILRTETPGLVVSSIFQFINNNF